MKKLYWIYVSMSCVFLLVSCSTPKYCGYPTECWKKYFIESPCGTYVKSRCEDLCDHCTFNEPICQQCWECVKHDGCGYGNENSCHY